MDTISQPSQGKSAVRTGPYITVSLLQLSLCCCSFIFHCFITCITCYLSSYVPFLPVPWYSREMPCMHYPLNHCRSNWNSAQLLSLCELTNKVSYPKSCTFYSRKYSCDMYLFQPNELPVKAHSTASIFPPKETTLYYVCGRVLILLSSGRVR